MTIEKYARRLPGEHDLRDLLRKKRKTLEILRSRNSMEIRGYADELVEIAGDAIREKDVDRVVELIETINDFLDELDSDLNVIVPVIKFSIDHYCKAQGGFIIKQKYARPRPEDILLSKEQIDEAEELIASIKYAKNKLGETLRELKYWKSRLIARAVYK